jgi:hypothetical protein
MKKTEAHRNAIIAGDEKDLNLSGLINDAISNGVFPKHGTDSNYSASWIIGRLRLNDRKVSDKLKQHSDSIK